MPALAIHPLAFLYAIFHACIAPIAGHDGFESPGGGAGYHYLHHSTLEVNYGVPWPVNLDALFGSWCDYSWVDATRSADGKTSIRRAKRYGRLLAELGSADAARAALAKEGD